jgi:hypothetical protein
LNNNCEKQLTWLIQSVGEADVKKLIRVIYGI